MPRKKLNQVQMYAEQTTGVRLSSHEKLCAERMNNILKSIEEMKREIKSLRQDVSMGKGGLKVIIAVATLIVGIIGFFQFK
jgi:Glu-tRNA(Gln) amidotransferase subunit E-like FAD-binding protein